MAQPEIYWRIYSISEDGLLKVPRENQGYGHYHDLDDRFPSENAAIDHIAKRNLRGPFAFIKCVYVAYGDPE